MNSEEELRAEDGRQELANLVLSNAGQLSRLDPRDGCYVLHCDLPLSAEQVERMRLGWESLLPGVKLLVLQRGLRLCVMGQPPDS